MSENCVFCRIILGQLPTTFVHHNEHVIVIKDIAPKAPVHYLIIPRKHLADVSQFSRVEDKELAGEIFLMAQEIAQKENISSFRLINNNGSQVGQSVFHVHVHFLAGKVMEF